MRNNLFVLTLALSLFLIGCNDGSGGNGMMNGGDAAMGLDGGMMMDAATGLDAGPACQVVTSSMGNKLNYWNYSVYDEVVTSVTVPTDCAVSGVTPTVSLWKIGDNGNPSVKIQDLGTLPFSGSVTLPGATPPMTDGGTATNVYSVHVTGVSCAAFTVCQ